MYMETTSISMPDLDINLKLDYIQGELTDVVISTAAGEQNFKDIPRRTVEHRM